MTEHCGLPTRPPRSRPPDPPYSAERCECCGVWAVHVFNTLFRMKDDDLRALSRQLAVGPASASTGGNGGRMAVQLSASEQVFLVFAPAELQDFRRVIDNAVLSLDRRPFRAGPMVAPGSARPDWT